MRNTSYPSRAALALVALTLSGTSSAAAQCITQPDSLSTYLGRARRLYAHVDSAEVAARGYPYAAPNQITIVTDTSVCSAALAAYNLSAGTTGTPSAISSVYVFAIGDMGWIVVNPTDTAGEFLMYHIFNTSWVLKSSVAS